MKNLLVNFLLEHGDLQWEISEKTEEILLRAIDEVFEKYPEVKEYKNF